ncbi:MAG: hypothetical protein K8T25_24800 [Planctomycetia bacterium]|nr:hypothetical protein [Planctomycetia bacterium]
MLKPLLRKNRLLAWTVVAMLSLSLGGTQLTFAAGANRGDEDTSKEVKEVKTDTEAVTSTRVSHCIEKSRRCWRCTLAVSHTAYVRPADPLVLPVSPGHRLASDLLAPLLC